MDAVIFDMDGLILDSEPVYRDASRSAAAELGYDFTDALYEQLIGRHERDVESSIRASLGIDFPIAEFRSRWARHWERIVAERGISLKPGVGDVLDAVSALGVPYAIATSTNAARAARSLAAGRIEHRFPTVIAGDAVQRGKPAPDIYQRTAARLGVRAERCVALEDSDPGVLSAAAANMLALMIPDLKPPSAAARAAAYRVLASLHAAVPVIEALARGWPGSTQPL
jgi:HAD superfamily hydrolase (TIGR01509 family)